MLSKDSESDLENFRKETNSSDYSGEVKGRWGQFKDSFKRGDVKYEELSQDMDETERANIGAAKSPLLRDLKNRHLQMIAIGGSVGTGLLIGSGSTLRIGGPASLVIAWGLVGTMVFCTVHALGELCVAFPVSGAFSNYAARFVDTSWGFAVGWNYAIMWLIVLPLELVAAAMSIQYWNRSINPAAWVAIFYVFILVINLFGVKGYGEAEFYLAIVKVIAIVGFIILGTIIVCGGGPTHHFIGAKNWHDPGAFANGFKGVCSVFVTASYSLAGSEMVGLAAAETNNPKHTLPKAIKQVFWRIFLFYILSLTLIGLIVPYDSPELMGSSNDASASPFVIAIRIGGINALPSIFNAVILISVISVGNSAVYGCSRTIQSLGAQGLGPSFLNYVDKKGRPLAGLGISALFGLLCFLSAYDNEAEVFAWLLSVGGLATIFSWFSIVLCHFRFRLAMRYHKRSLDELSFKSVTGIWGSLYSMVFLIVVLGVQFWVALFPVGGNGKPNAKNFFQNYLGVIVIAIFYVAHKMYMKNWRICLKLSKIDLDTGRREKDSNLMDYEVEQDEENLRQLPFYRKVLHFFV
ncbi:Piso0_005495 [Millerozyma farinosa CBS 7064]|uniref:Piso0_005495 protein n=1 Tax=Pichia sorbitophila (strain ATCC MYA-4447 / BCRC 22081 / CBS 7064 / NBRC 10061 / NRRL Y-12695) TaxID=559304 RepID=G8XZ61_PICSO|nr:Piso0_005495 [Millerozyma farinosa CBS 7064]